jgi:hypothetical protein
MKHTDAELQAVESVATRQANWAKAPERSNMLALRVPARRLQTPTEDDLWLAISQWVERASR